MKTWSRTPLTWREYVRQCDLRDASRRRLEQMIPHGVTYIVALTLVAWELAQGII